MFAAPATPTGPRLIDDTPCRHCGYNLRSLPESGKCPECATPVALSVRGDLLKHADPAWVLTLARGATTVIWSISALVIGFILGMIFAIAVFAIDWLVLVIGSAAAIGLLIGQWLITQPDPSATVCDRPTTSRNVLRWLVLAAIALTGLQEIASLLGSLMSDPRVAFVMGFIHTALAACWIIAYSRHLACLFDRIPDTARAMKCRRIGPILVVLLLVAALRGVIPGAPAPGAWASGQSRLMIFVELVFGLLNLALLTYAIRALALNSALARLLRAEARKAEANWLSTPTQQ